MLVDDFFFYFIFEKLAFFENECVLSKLVLSHFSSPSTSSTTPFFGGVSSIPPLDFNKFGSETNCLTNTVSNIIVLYLFLDNSSSDYDGTLKTRTFVVIWPRNCHQMNSLIHRNCFRSTSIVTYYTFAANCEYTNLRIKLSQEEENSNYFTHITF